MSNDFPPLLKLPESRVRDVLGAPTSMERFRLGDRPDEFHVALQNTYPLSEARNESVEILEATWAKGDCRLTVWFHQVDGDWESLEAFRWPKGAEF